MKGFADAKNPDLSVCVDGSIYDLSEEINLIK